MSAYRIRPCRGNTKAWMLVRLNSDGTEADCSASMLTAMSVDALLRDRRLLVADRIEVVLNPVTPKISTPSRYEMAARAKGWTEAPNEPAGVVYRDAYDEERAACFSDLVYASSWRAACEIDDIAF